MDSTSLVGKKSELHHLWANMEEVPSLGKMYNEKTSVLDTSCIGASSSNTNYT